jgi:hypothetical protein
VGGAWFTGKTNCEVSALKTIVIYSIQQNVPISLPTTSPFWKTARLSFGRFNPEVDRLVDEASKKMKEENREKKATKYDMKCKYL